jgi:hypothetical protein
MRSVLDERVRHARPGQGLRTRPTGVVVMNRDGRIEQRHARRRVRPSRRSCNWTASSGNVNVYHGRVERPGQQYVTETEITYHCLKTPKPELVE